MEEIYKDIPNYEGQYQISNLGNVLSLKRKGRKQDLLLTPSKDNHGYLFVRLSKNRKTRNEKIHQLVAITFLNHIPDSLNLVVDHIDNEKLNNRLDNLQLISHRKNISKDRKGTSKYVGVYWSESHKKWRAQIVIKNKQKHLGSFEDELEASKAYQNELKRNI